MNIHNLDLDLNLPTDIPDLPPPWPSTEVAIDWWMNRVAWYPTFVASAERLAQPHRAHNSEPFVID